MPLATGGVRASDLADRLQVSRQAVAQAITGLERHGYIARAPASPAGNAFEGSRFGQRWERVLGRRRLAELRATLEALLAEETDAAGD